MKVYAVWLDDICDGKVIQGVYSSRVKAQACIDEMLTDEYEDEGIFSPEDLTIEEFYVE